MRALGATVIEVGEDFDDGRAAPPRRMPREHEAELLVDGDDPRISTGAATLALELTDAVDGRRTCRRRPSSSVPVGNGALINGVGVVAARARCRTAGSSASRPRAPRR